MRLHEQGLTTAQIAEEMKTTNSVVRKYLGCVVESGEPSRRDAVRDEFIRLLHGEGMSQADIASKFGISRQRMSMLFKRLGLTSLPNGRKLTDDQVREVREMLAAGMSRREIAASFGVRKGVIMGIDNKEYYSRVK